MKRIPFSKVRVYQHFKIEDTWLQKIPIRDGGYNAKDINGNLTTIRSSGIVEVDDV
jgi:hypothetical protein